MATGNRVDPYKNYNFLVEIDGITQAAFRECSGLDHSNKAIEYRVGNEPTRVRKLPGKTTYSDIVLKWGITDSTDLYDWRKKVVSGEVERKNGSIVLLNDKAEELMRWNFVDAWPTKWEGPSFNATADEVAIESLTLAHEGVDKG